MKIIDKLVLKLIKSMIFVLGDMVAFLITIQADIEIREEKKAIKYSYSQDHEVGA